MKVSNKKILVKIIKFSLLVIVLYLLGKYLATHWGRLKEYKFEINPYYFVISVFCSFATLFIGALNWRSILVSMYKLNISHWDSIRIFSLSILGRYIPGKVFYVAGKVMLGAEYGLPKSKLSLSVIIEIIFTFSCAGCIFLWGIIWNFNLKIIWMLAIPFSGVLLFLLTPIILIKFKRVALRISKFESDFSYAYVPLLKCQIRYLFLWLFQGLSIFFMISSLTPISVTKLPFVTASFALACSIGIFSFLAPAGIGVRDYILLQMLSVVVAPDISIIVSILSRIIFTLSEATLAFLTNVHFFFSKRKVINS